MKKTVFLLMLLFTVSSLSAVEAKTREFDPTLVHAEVQKIIQKYPPKITLTEDLVVLVEITLNDDNEIVVIDMTCNNEDLKGYIRSTLNYKKIKGELDRSFIKSVVPLRFKSA